MKYGAFLLEIAILQPLKFARERSQAMKLPLIGSCFIGLSNVNASIITKWFYYHKNYKMLKTIYILYKVKAER